MRETTRTSRAEYQADRRTSQQPGQPGHVLRVVTPNVADDVKAQSFAPTLSGSAANSTRVVQQSEVKGLPQLTKLIGQPF
jgi:hypothetical protein